MSQPERNSRRERPIRKQQREIGRAIARWIASLSDKDLRGFTRALKKSARKP